MYLTKQQLFNIGFKSLGYNVLISDKASIYNPANISIGNNVRIDDFAILSAGSGGIEIHNFVHVAAGAKLIGQGKIILEDYSGISSDVKLLSSTDDFSGEYFAGVTIADELRNVKSGQITIKRKSTIGAGCVVLPNVTVGENSALGAMSLLKVRIPDNEIYAGIPAVFLKYRIIK